VCIVQSTQEIVFNRITDTNDWVTDFWQTVEDLNDYKERCESITIKLFSDMCLATYDLKVTYEFTRLSNDLKKITDERLSTLFIEAVRGCIPSIII
jgi:hypothetical protein